MLDICRLLFWILRVCFKATLFFFCLFNCGSLENFKLKGHYIWINKDQKHLIWNSLYVCVHVCVCVSLKSICKKVKPFGPLHWFLSRSENECKFGLLLDITEEKVISCLSVIWKSISMQKLHYGCSAIKAWEDRHHPNFRTVKYS